MKTETFNARFWTRARLRQYGRTVRPANRASHIQGPTYCKLFGKDSLQHRPGLSSAQSILGPADSASRSAWLSKIAGLCNANDLSGRGTMRAI